jgi:hypothetical protein
VQQQSHRLKRTHQGTNNVGAKESQQQQRRQQLQRRGHTNHHRRTTVNIDPDLTRYRATQPLSKSQPQIRSKYLKRKRERWRQQPPRRRRRWTKEPERRKRPIKGKEEMVRPWKARAPSSPYIYILNEKVWIMGKRKVGTAAVAFLREGFTWREKGLLCVVFSKWGPYK